MVLMVQLRGFMAAGLSVWFAVLSPSWAATYEVHPGESIQAAIDSATHGDVIVVMPGRYIERINFMGKNMTIRSMTPDNPVIVAATIIDGSRSGSVVTFENGESRRGMLEGIHLTGGDSLYGGGVFIDEASPVIRSCLLSKNLTFNIGSIAGAGAGVYCRDGRPRIEDCRFIQNHSQDDGGGIFAERSDVVILNCSFDRNETHDAGGGIYVGDSSTARILKCVFSSNTGHWGGAIHARSNSLLEIGWCDIRANSAETRGGGISVISRTDFFLRNSLLVDNHSGTLGGAGVGGAIDAQNLCDGVLQNCTIVRNSSASKNGGIKIQSISKWQVANSILWENEVLRLPPDTSIHNSVTERGRTADGNISDDPLFINAMTGDFRLSQNSPCIDSGRNELFGTPGFSGWAFGDLDERVRTWDGDGDGIPTIDMGAFEFGLPAFVGDLTGDELVDSIDILASLGQWRATTPPSPVFGDQNGDKRFDANDLMVLRRAWGREYE